MACHQKPMTIYSQHDTTGRVNGWSCGCM